MDDYKMFEILIELDIEEFVISRRVLISEHILLCDLHNIIQILYGWKGYHLHQYVTYKKNGVSTVYFDKENEFYDGPYKLTKNLRIDNFLNENEKCEYIYDMGDYWVHRLNLINIHPNPIGVNKALCIDGNNDSPPEDVGGVGGYLYFLEVLSDKKHPDYDHLKSWATMMKTPKLNINSINNKLAKKYK